MLTKIRLFWKVVSLVSLESNFQWAIAVPLVVCGHWFAKANQENYYPQLLSQHFQSIFKQTTLHRKKKNLQHFQEMTFLYLCVKTSKISMIFSCLLLLVLFFFFNIIVLENSLFWINVFWRRWVKRNIQPNTVWKTLYTVISHNAASSIPRTYYNILIFKRLSRSHNESYTNHSSIKI